MSVWKQIVCQAVDAQFERMVELRRHLHMHPEPSGAEYKTSQLLYELLGDAGLRVRQGPEGCGVMADFVPPPRHTTGLRLALRADIDALQIQDEKEVSYRSQKPDVMHACGHDAHTAILTGVLLAIRQLQLADLLPFQPVLRGIFQPAEEICRGACLMIESGALEGVDAVLAAHVDPSRAVGKIGLRPGVFTANCDEMKITIRGLGGHAARPHETRDPISAAAQLINWIYLQSSRNTDSQEAVVLTVGRIEGGHNANVIPDRVELHGTMRTLDAAVRTRTIELVRRLCHAVADGTQTQVEVEFGMSTRAVDNDPDLVELLWKATEATLGPDAPQRIPRPSMGSEDFAFYGAVVPTAMFRLGCRRADQPVTGLHTPNFDIDEEALRCGARVLTHAALDWMSRHSDTPLSSADHRPDTTASAS